MKERYRNIVTDVAAKAFTKEKLLAEIDLMDKVIKEPLTQEKKVREARKEKADKFGAWVTGFFDAQPDMRVFVERRADAVAKQVEGMKK